MARCSRWSIREPRLRLRRSRQGPKPDVGDLNCSFDHPDRIEIWNSGRLRATTSDAPIDQFTTTPDLSTTRVGDRELSSDKERDAFRVWCLASIG